jgi:[citrate (pro-3S)-lyase] ligase
MYAGYEERELRFSREKEQRKNLLASRGLSVPGNEDVILGLFDGERLLATGALVGNIIEGVAVLPEMEGEGASAKLVGSLLKKAEERGFGHLFLFTKPQEASRFIGLGFSEVVGTEEAALLEWGRPDVEDYKKTLREAAETRAHPSSCIVINGNPFTKGHRHLIETALAHSKNLYVPVVEEDLSEFPFDVRFRLVREGTADLSGVTVLEGGPYLVSSATFPSYFTREERLGAVHAQLDTTLFARHIAPALMIDRRFVGEEPYSPVTAAYNAAMKSILPAWGVEVVEIPRLQVKGKLVSASSVRRLICEDNLSDVEPLVPPATWRYLTSEEAVPVLEKIRNSRARSIIDH